MDLTAQLTPVRQNHLLKILGIGFGLAIVVGGMIGGGILRTPGIVAANLGSFWLIIGVWAFGGLYALVGANTYAELATMLPEAGGGYVYIRRAYGNFLGFAGGMNDVVLNSCGLAYLSIITGEYISALVPSLSGRENLVGILTLLAIAMLNWVGLRAGDLAQKLTSLVKVLAFGAVICACFIFGDLFAASSAASTTFGSPLAAFAAVAISIQSVMETYAGWNTAVYFTEENTDPGKTIPRAMFGGVLIVMTVYVLFNLALMYVLPIADIAGSKLPIADAAGRIFGASGGNIVTALALCSMLGILNANVLYIPRVLFSMSRAGFLPQGGAFVNRGGTPVVALAVAILLTFVFAMSGTFETLLSIAAFLGLAQDSACYLALFVLRRREPELPRPFRSIGYPILPGIVLLGAWILLAVYAIGNTTYSLYSVGILLLLYPTFLIFRKFSKTPETNEV